MLNDGLIIALAIASNQNNYSYVCNTRSTCSNQLYKHYCSFSFPVPASLLSFKLRLHIYISACHYFCFFFKIN